MQQLGKFDRFFKYLLVLSDLFFLNTIYIISYALAVGNFELFSNKQTIIVLVFSNLIWIILFTTLKIYLIERVLKIRHIYLNVIKIIVIHSLLIFSLILIIGLNNVKRSHIYYFYTILAVFQLYWRLIIVFILKKYRKSGYNFRTSVIIGAGVAGKEVKDYLVSDKSFGINFLGYFDDNPIDCVSEKELILGDTNDIFDFAKNNHVDEIICALPSSADNKVKKIIQFAENNLIRIKIIPDFRRYIQKKISLEFLGNIPTILIRDEPLQRTRNKILKRAFDLLFSSLVFILFNWWLIPIIGILIKLESPGPIFFKQKRTGINNKDFYIWKFRTMRVNNDSDKVQATKNDKRITKFGDFLRRSSLDEFPQFINVFLGDMSVVGPRPHMLKHTEDYKKIVNKFMVRHLVKPGITGWAQVNGFRGETKKTRLMEKRVEYDMWYVENWSFYLDLKIILLTILNGIKGEEMAY